MGLALSLGLGSWQIARLRWKEAILARIDAAEHAEPVPFTLRPPDFARLRATGHFSADSVRYGTELRETPAGARLGSRVIQPLHLADGGTVLVDRGWAPDEVRPPVPEGETTVIGYARPAEAGGWATPADDPGSRHFYAPRPDRMAAALQVGPVAPFLLVALGRPVPGLYPQPAVALPRPANDHLQYALTWYGLGVVLVVMFWLRFRPFTRKG